MEATKAIASMPPGHRLKHRVRTVEIYKFLTGCTAFTKEKMPWCPCPFKTKHTGLGML